jgi:hypothetical protein
MTPRPMPRKVKPPVLRRTTPFPNVLLDLVLPKLTDTEWRIVCVIVRQTFGWSAGQGTRKQSDWLSHAQLRRRTGRASAALSRAIDVLVRSGILSVRDLTGRLLTTAQARRRSRSRLSFSVRPRVLRANSPKQVGLARKRNSRSENDKRN